MRIHGLLSGLIAILFIGCSQQAELPQSEELINSSLIGSWSGGGEHWTFARDGIGNRASYTYTPHLPFDGDFTWQVHNGAFLRLQYTKSSDWSNQLSEYEITALTKNKLILSPVEGSGKEISMTLSEEFTE